jgi:hypothetical protein
MFAKPRTQEHVSPSSSIRLSRPLTFDERAVSRKGAVLLRTFRATMIGLVLAVWAWGCSETHLAATRWGGADASLIDANPQASDVDGPACLRASIDLTLPKATVVLVAERSSAMNVEPCAGCDTPWDSLVSATGSLTRADSNQFQWGLMLYPSPGQRDVCAVSSTLDVYPASDSAATLALAMQAAAPPAGEAPATLAVRQVLSYFSALQNNTPKIAVLAMGGSPTCGGADNAQDDFSATLSEIEKELGVFVFVLGVGPKRAGLDRLAVAGGTTSSYASTGVATLRSDMERLAWVMASCSFDMPAAPLPGQSVQVELDTTPVAADDHNGYSLSSDGLRLTLKGVFCDYLGGYSS